MEGVTGSALLFDGGNDRVEIPDDPGLRIGPSFTVEAWVHRDGSGSSDVILSKGDSNRRNYLVLIDSSNRVDFRWETTGGSNHGTISPAVDWTGWRHVACVYDATAGENRIYVDGVLIESASDSGTPTTSTDPLFIGARVSSSNLRDWFVGSIDLVRVASFAMYDENFTPPTVLGNGTPVPRFQLAWQPPASSPWVAGYHVYRRVDDWPVQRLTATPIPEPSFVDAGPPSGTISYSVTAVDLLGQEGPVSLLASIPNRIVDITKGKERVGDILSLQAPSILSRGPSEIRYTLPGAATVRLVAYDVRGRLVAVLDDGPRTPGTHAVRWPAAGTGADHLASGTYFLLLTADGQRVSRKMTLVR